MARRLQRLSAKAVQAEKRPGYHADGGGLYLQVSPAGTKSWVFRFKLSGRAREMGLGPLHAISLADARERAAHCRKLLVDRIDPIEAREQERMRSALKTAKTATFAECATAYIKGHRAGWKNSKHGLQWGTTLETYAYPTIGNLNVADIDASLVLRVLEPIWTEKTETATRLRQRIEHVLDWAQVHGYRTGENPARWKGHLDKTLPKPSKVKRVTHHAALDYDRVGEFMQQLKEQEGIAARALEFAILTAARTGEVIGATWDEVDLQAREWRISAARMKAGKPHRVALSEPAVAILKAMQAIRIGEHVFPGQGEGRPLSNMAMLVLLRRMERQDVTVHGFRASFKTWASETTAFPREVIEMALAHRLGDKAEQAYARGDLLQKRMRLMEAWGQHCSVIKPAGTVLPFKSEALASRALG